MLPLIYFTLNLNSQSQLIVLSLERFDSNRNGVVIEIFFIIEGNLWFCRGSLRVIVVIIDSWSLGLIVRKLTFLVFCIKSTLIFYLISTIVSTLVSGFMPVIVSRFISLLRRRILSCLIPWTFCRSIVMIFSSQISLIVVHFKLMCSYYQ